MIDALFGHNGPAAVVDPLWVALRLVVALGLGWLVALIYVKTSRRVLAGETFPITLALLAVLIAMVTQVIGDNVARAFSLVGALSIVRFRTVVKDTKDTAYVIFAVVVGMAVGAQNFWVAAIGIVVIGMAMMAAASWGQGPEKTGPAYQVAVRLGSGQEMSGPAADLLDAHMQSRELLSVGTIKQGSIVEYVFEGRLRSGKSPEHLVRAMSGLEGVQDIRLHHKSTEGEQSR